MANATLLRPRILLLLSLGIFLTKTQAQTFWTDTFSNENNATSNWINSGANNGPARWTWTTDPSAGYQEPDLPAFAAPTATDGYFYFDSDNNGLVPHDARLTNIGSPVDCSGKNDVHLRFFTQYIYFNPTGTEAQIGISTDSLNFTYFDLFDSLQPNSPYHDWVEVDLDEADGQPKIWLQFRWIGNYEYHWKIDDLELFTQTVDLPCSAGQAGNFTLPTNGTLCLGDSLSNVLSLDSSSFVLPNIGPLSGLAWCFTQASIPANTWPGDIPGIVSTPFSTEINKPFLINDAGTLDHGVYFLTPVVLGAGDLLNPADPPYVSNVDTAGACYFVGQSQQLVLLPAVAPLTISAQVSNAQIPPGNNGAIMLTFGGGSGAFFNNPAQYQFLWSNGATSPNLNDLAAGTYTVTVTDASGCTADLVETFTIEETVGSTAPTLLQQLTVQPNPSTGIVQINVRLASAAALHFELVDMLGQVVKTAETGKVNTWSQALDLTRLPDGIYLLRTAAGSEIMLQRIVLQR